MVHLNNSLSDEEFAHKDDYKALVRVAILLNSESNLDHLLDLIISESNRLLEADRTSLYLVDYESNEVYTKIALGVDGFEIRVPLGKGLCGTVAVTGETINIREAQSDDRHAGDMSDYITHTLLTMPLRTHSGKIVGVIQAINKKTGVFDARDEEILAAFCGLAAVSIENATLRRDIERMFNSFVVTMAKTIDARSPQTSGHSERVAQYAKKVALQLGMMSDQVRLIELAGLLHDYGKIGVPEAILMKPGRLTEEEWVWMRSHVVQTREILSNIYFIGDLNRIPLIAGQHHERVSGKGYPLGLPGDKIEFEAKILAVADVFDALTYKRYYRNPMTADEALDHLTSLIDIEFDETCVNALKEVIARDGPPLNTDFDPDAIRQAHILGALKTA
ncbi:MAG: HD domain-containing phosphohydrolase [Chloroflexota bacterium]|nr:HD domain-containing protein [Chloroflexota bacterium]